MPSGYSGELRERAALITGAASGIGRATARFFGEHGASLVVVDIDRERLETVASEPEDSRVPVQACAGDIGTETLAQNAVDTCVAAFGRLDVLVNAAGVVHVGNVRETSLEDWRRIFRTNVEAVFLGSRAAIPALSKRRNGTIVNVASEAALVGLASYAAYAASKSAVLGLTRSMALDHASVGLRVNCVCPGSIETPLLQAFYDRQPDPVQARAEDKIDHPLGIGSPEQVAQSILFLAGPRSEYITGHALAVDGGYTCQ